MERPRFIANLESVRGLAALIVCLFHASVMIEVGGSNIAPPVSVLGVLINGHGAVPLFFLLSGYVLRLGLTPRQAAPAGQLSASFLTARAFRLYPVVVATVALFGMIALVEGRAYPFSLLARNAALLDVSINGVFWTLQLEVVGSVLVIGAFLLERRWGLWPVVVLAVGLRPFAFLGNHSGVTPLFQIRFLEAFVFGYLLAAWPRARGRPAWAAALLVAGGLCLFYYGRLLGDPFKQWPLVLTEIGACAMVVGLSAESLSGALSWPPLRWLGAVSYSFYAVHLLGVGLAGRLAGVLERRHWPAWAIIVVALVGSAAMTAPIAVVMRGLVERPGMALGRRLAGRVRPLQLKPEPA
jgi:peptidoglycan/LPS O-acetylase OafA/YrhL